MYPDSLGLQCMLAYCLRNDEFRADFEAICKKMASEESTALLLAELAKGADAIAPEMARHIDRWEHVIGNGYSVKTWEKAYASIKQYVGARPAYFLKYLDRALDRTKE